MPIQQFTKKPEVVEAAQFQARGGYEVVTWFNESQTDGSYAVWYDERGPLYDAAGNEIELARPEHLVLSSPYGGSESVFPGSWVVRNDDNQFSVLSDEKFNNRYALNN